MQWRERLNRWLAPLAVRTPLAPNTITAAALIINLAAATLLIAGRLRPALLLVGAAAIAVGGFLDALDGAVARARQATTRWGDFLDHLFDRISDIAVITGWCLGAAVRPEIALAAVISVALNGYIGTQIEATFGRRSYLGTGRAEFVLAVVAFPLIQFTVLTSGNNPTFLGFTIAEAMTVLLTLFAVFGIVERFLEARRLAR